MLLFSVADVGAVGVTLKGSPASIQRQHLVAKEQGFAFVETPDQVPELVASDVLISVTGGAHYDVLSGVSYKVARPEMRLFIERLAEQYHEGTGEKLVVTSLTRPSSEQPRNSHPLSVHPTGMAVDLRVSARQQSRAWLESVLLMLEREGVLDVTRERYPPHYHVALFPEAYTDYLGSLIGEEAVAEALTFPAPPEPEKIERPAVARRAGKVARTAVAAVTPPSDDDSPTAWLALALVPLVLVPGVMLWRRRVAPGARQSGTADLS